MHPAALLALTRVRDQSLDLKHLRDQLAMQALKTRGVNDALRLGSHAARICDGSSSSGQQGISVSGH